VQPQGQPRSTPPLHWSTALSVNPEQKPFELSQAGEHQAFTNLGNNKKELNVINIKIPIFKI
jgi:hypothetical protein